MKNLQGFKKLEDLPSRSRRSKYDDLIKEVNNTGNTYYITKKNEKMARSLTSTLRVILKRKGIEDISVHVSGNMVYVMKENDDV